MSNINFPDSEDPCPFRSECDITTLDCVVKGDVFEIVSVDDERSSVQAIRFGLSSGARSECLTKIPFGPIVIRIGRQEIAIGRNLAKKIRIRQIQSDPPKPANV